MKKILIIVLVLALSLIACEEKTTEDMVLIEAEIINEDNNLIENDFYIAKNHVTQKEFEEIMGFNPSYFKDENHSDLTGDSDDRPVENLTWYDAIMYCNKLSEAEGLDKYYQISDIEYLGEESGKITHPQSIIDATVKENEAANGYRLPTEKEHIYATANARMTYREGNNSKTKVVGENEANNFGLHDMTTNVNDWTNTLSGSNRVIRGGYQIYPPSYCGINYSYNYSPAASINQIGFRLARNYH